MRARLRDSLKTEKKRSWHFLAVRKAESKIWDSAELSVVITYCFSTHSAPTSKTFPLGSFDSHSAGWDVRWAPLKFQWQETFPSARPQLPLMITAAFWKACVGKASGINNPNWEENPTNLRRFDLGWERKTWWKSRKREGQKERHRERECQGQALLIWRLN